GIAAASRRDEERRLGEAVARSEGGTAESARGEPGSEGVQRLQPHRLGSDGGAVEAGEVECRPLLFADGSDAQVVCGTWAARGGGAAAGYGLEPTGGTLQERHRRHQEGVPAVVDGLENDPNEAHVMVRRQPGDADGLAGV